MRQILFFLFIFIQASFPQQKYIIYFTDKGIDPKVLTKNSAGYSEALSGLSDRSIVRREKVMGEKIITFEDIPLKQDYLDSLTASGIEVINILKWFNAVSAYITEEDKSSLLKLSFIKSIEPVRSIKSRKPETEQLLRKALQDSGSYGNSYTQLRLSGITRVHARGITGRGVLLGVLDTGFRWRTHEALSAADVLAEYDFIFDDDITENQPEDVPSQHNHGTIVFSVISGYKDSILIGAAYNAQFLLAKTEDIRSETRVEEDNYAAALEWMENFGVDITTSSLGYNEFDDFSYSYSDMDGRTTIVTRAAELAFQRGVLTITSAGNEGNSPWIYITAPADGVNIIAVGAVDAANRIAGFSSRGPTADGRIKPEVLAMGVSVFGASAFMDNAYGAASGTSLAAPIAAGSAALLLSAFPHLSNIQMRDIIIRTADNYSLPNNFRGYGLISASESIEYPNLEFRNNRYILNKMFITSDPAQVKVFFSTDRENFTEYDMNRDSTYFYFSIPVYTKNQKVYFYFDGQDSPSDYYTFSYGDMIISRSDIRISEYILSNNFPNPFNNLTNINFVIKQQSDVELNIYDALGQKVITLFSGSAVMGEYTVSWNGRRDNGIYCASGIYIYRLRINGSEYTGKMVLLR
jgi:serine protease AprX